MQMYDVDDKDFILGEIMAVSGSRLATCGDHPDPVWILDLEQQPAPEHDKLSRLNAFSRKPTAGNANEFVKKIGDRMSGTLHMDNAGDATDLDLDVLKANINFRTVDPNDDTNFKDVTIYQNGFNESLSISGGLRTEGSVYSEAGKFRGASPSGQYWNAFKPYLELQTTAGSLSWDGDDRLSWTEEGVTINKPIADTADGRGFVIEGATTDDYSGKDLADVVDQTGHLLGVYHNNNGVDAINYKGKIVNAKNIVTKEYVDDAVDGLRWCQQLLPGHPAGQETVDLKFNAGDLWIDSTDLTGYVWAETAWAQMSLDNQGGGGGGSATNYYQDTAPVEDPAEPFNAGDLWIDSTDSDRLCLGRDCLDADEPGWSRRRCDQTIRR